MPSLYTLKNTLEKAFDAFHMSPGNWRGRSRQKKKQLENQLHAKIARVLFMCELDAWQTCCVYLHTTMASSGLTAAHRLLGLPINQLWQVRCPAIAAFATRKRERPWALARPWLLEWVLMAPHGTLPLPKTSVRCPMPYHAFHVLPVCGPCA